MGERWSLYGGVIYSDPQNTRVKRGLKIDLPTNRNRKNVNNTHEHFKIDFKRFPAAPGTQQEHSKQIYIPWAPLGAQTRSPWDSLGTALGRSSARVEVHFRLNRADGGAHSHL